MKPLDYCALVGHAEEIHDLTRALSAAQHSARVFEDMAVAATTAALAYRAAYHTSLALQRSTSLAESSR